MVLGGDSEDIARAIWAAKAAGIQTYGTESVVTFADDRGVTRSVYFSRPTSLSAYATLLIITDPATYAGDAAVETAFLAAMEGLRAGEVARNAIAVAALLEVTGVRDAVVWMGSTSTFTSQTRDNLAPTERQRIVFDSARVEVTSS